MQAHVRLYRVCVSDFLYLGAKMTLNTASSQGLRPVRNGVVVVEEEEEEEPGG